ncbi:unnamed protein product [Pleuronectes platessa]|uniref:Uncharacterized protein n=1 Tax=Pleuronectes platessa TaxID=8262 RepID=A0A9N7YW44_PLEPL|nr:unnamed protein product [Pleuronectes platessa]
MRGSEEEEEEEEELIESAQLFPVICWDVTGEEVSTSSLNQRLAASGLYRTVEFVLNADVWDVWRSFERKSICDVINRRPWTTLRGVIRALSIPVACDLHISSLPVTPGPAQLRSGEGAGRKPHVVTEWRSHSASAPTPVQTI